MTAREYTVAEAIAMALQHIRICAPDPIVEAALEAIDVSPAPVFDMEAAVNAFGDAFYGGWGDGSPSTSWRTCPGLQPEVTPAITKALTAALPHLMPDMEALRRDAERYRFLRTASNELRRVGRTNLLLGNFDEDLDKAIDAALAAQRDTSEGGG